MSSSNKRKLVLLGVLFLLLAVGLWWVRSSYQKHSQRILVEQTDYESGGFAQQWPLSIVNNSANSYMIRVVLEPEIYTGFVEFNGLELRAWSYGLVKDKSGNMQRIAIPRAWYHAAQRKVYFLGAATPTSVESFTDKFLLGTIKGLNDILNSNKQPLVAAYFFPNDQDINLEVINFFRGFSQVTLPDSFVKTGDIKDLPSSIQTGHFLPITQLMFDIDQNAK